MSFIETECSVEILRWSGRGGGGYTVRITDKRSDVTVAEVELTYEQFGQAIGGHAVATGKVVDDNRLIGRYYRRYIIKTDAWSKTEGGDGIRHLERSAAALADWLADHKPDGLVGVPGISSLHHHNNGTSIWVDYTVTDKPDTVVVARLTPDEAFQLTETDPTS